MLQSIFPWHSHKTTKRFTPYSTPTVRDRYLGKLHLHSSNDKSIGEQFKTLLTEQKPRHTQHMSVDEKIGLLRKLIGEVPVTTPTTSAAIHQNLPSTYQHFDRSNTLPKISPEYRLWSTPARPESVLFPSFEFKWREREQKHKDKIEQHMQNAIQNQPPTFQRLDRSNTFPEESPEFPLPMSTSARSESVPVPVPNFESKWREQKRKDEKEQRIKKVKQLEEELKIRERSRHIRTIEGEEDRRLRFQLEGIRLERRIPPREEFPELSSQAKQIVKIIWDRSKPFTEVITSAFGADITRKDMLTLYGSEWLNDEVINCFINLLVERSEKNSNFPKVYAFNTFFYQKLFQMGYAAVKRWTRKVDIFSYQMLLIPIHLGNHWCMAIVDFVQRRVDYYDSLMGNNQECLQALNDYLRQESMDKKKEQLDTSDWTFTCRKDIPTQKNLCDCGMFACLFAEYASRRARITFDQKHIPYFRQRMAFEIYQKELL